jgi:hypothetical protein
VKRAQLDFFDQKSVFPDAGAHFGCVAGPASEKRHFELSKSVCEQRAQHDTAQSSSEARGLHGLSFVT